MTLRANPINPSEPVQHYSDWALDNASSAEELRGWLRTDLQRVRPLLEQLSRMGAYLPGTSAEELLAHVEEVLEGDWDCGHDRDLEKFQGEVE